MRDGERGKKNNFGIFETSQNHQIALDWTSEIRQSNAPNIDVGTSQLSFGFQKLSQFFQPGPATDQKEVQPAKRPYL